MLALAAVPACVAETQAVDKVDDESDAFVDGKLDGASITDHGDFVFDDSNGRYSAGTMTATLASNARSHAWTFELTGDADVSFETAAFDVGEQQGLDTVMYLYKRGTGSSWGRYIVRNDDKSETNLFSYFGRELGEGEYRVVVKGYSRTDEGPFRLSAHCEGGGCPEATPITEVCGTQIGDLEERGYLVPGHSNSVNSNTRVNMLLGQQIVAAVSWTNPEENVSTWREAIAIVDDDSMVTSEYTVAETGQKLTLVDFTLGDNQYGALFVEGTTELFAHIADGDVTCPE